MFTDRDWLEILSGLGVRPATAARWQHPFEDEVQPEKFSEGIRDLLDWLPQILHESSMLERTEECLSYNPERLCVVWPGRFPTLASAVLYAHAPQKLANMVYGGRMGNSLADDGWRFRGRGVLQITGRAAYAHVGELLGLDLVGDPDQASEPAIALRTAIAWWESNIPDTMLGDQVRLRRRVNGGTLGLEHVAGLRVRLSEMLA